MKRSDFCIIGSGIVGLNTALRLKELHPKASVTILERGALPAGASTKNAGFACFGSISELEEDLLIMGESKSLETVEMRWRGLQMLKDLHGNIPIEYLECGGLEVFRSSPEKKEEQYLSRISHWNNLLKGIIGPNVYQLKEKPHSFSKTFTQKCILNQYEGLLHPGKLIQLLLHKCRAKGVEILTGFEVKSYETESGHVAITGEGWEMKCGHILLATNAFTSDLISSAKVSPARNLVLLTQPIPEFKMEQGIHLDKGYFYFRKIYDRILIGGGRHLAEEEESTAKFGSNPLIKKELIRILEEDLLPGSKVEIQREWSGILGLGNERSVLIRRLDDRSAMGVRLGGMGVAIGTLVGRQLAELFH